MTRSPTTRLSLVLRLGDPNDREAWGRFVELYAPVLYRFFRRRTLQDADAADLTQDVLHVVAKRVNSFAHNEAPGAFRAWLYTIARNRLRHFLDQRHRSTPPGGDWEAIEPAEDLPAPDEDAAAWDQDYRRRVFAWASDQVRARVDPSTWQAFWQTAIEGRTGEEVGQSLGMSTGAVYMAKSRVMARLRKLVDEIELLEGD